MLQRDSKSATALLASAHADDASDYSEHRGRCQFCGREDQGVPATDAVSVQYFSDDDIATLPASDHVCWACAYCMDTRTLKQGHWIVHQDGVEQPSTGDLLAVFRDLRHDAYEPPLAVHVTSSPIRSSHAYLWTPVNETVSPLTVAYDRQTVRIRDWVAFAGLVAAVEDLRVAGATFAEIRSGEPRVRSLRSIGRDEYRRRDARIAPHRRTARLELALTLSRGADDQPRDGLAPDHDPLDT